MSPAFPSSSPCHDEVLKDVAWLGKSLSAQLLRLVFLGGGESKRSKRMILGNGRESCQRREAEEKALCQLALDDSNQGLKSTGVEL